MEIQVRTIFDWLKHINEYKTPVSEFTSADWDVFNSYMIHRFMSMHRDGLALANEAQKLHPTDKIGVYSFYKYIMPKNNSWIKYMKSKSKPYNQDLLTELADYFKLSQREIKDYMNILDKPEIKRILHQRGIEDKQIKKLLK